jgi:hypothetical protein
LSDELDDRGVEVSGDVINWLLAAATVGTLLFGDAVLPRVSAWVTKTLRARNGDSRVGSKFHGMLSFLKKSDFRAPV